MELAKRFRRDWNYGNAIHSAHLVLGLLRLNEGQVEAAKKHLLDAGRTPGSPQLNSYGPSLNLARELLLQGETEVVVHYLNLIAKFWASEKNAPPGDMEEQCKAQANANRNLIEQWKTEVNSGQIPQHRSWDETSK